MIPTLKLGSMVLPTSPLVYIIGAWLALSVVERGAKSLKIEAERSYGIAAIGLGAGFVGARLFFVALHWPAYRQNLSGIVWPLTGGYDLWGGLVSAMAAGYLYGRAKEAPWARTLDALALGILVTLLAVSVADLLGGPGYGTETAVPWGLDLFGIRRHPVQIYEIIVALMALGAWSRLAREESQPGRLFMASAAVYATGRLLVDAFRANTPLTEGGYHVIQLVSLAAALSFIFVLGRQLPQE